MTLSSACWRLILTTGLSAPVQIRRKVAGGRPAYLRDDHVLADNSVWTRFIKWLLGRLPCLQHVSVTTSRCLVPLGYKLWHASVTCRPKLTVGQEPLFILHWYFPPQFIVDVDSQGSSMWVPHSPAVPKGTLHLSGWECEPSRNFRDVAQLMSVNHLAHSQLAIATIAVVIRLASHQVSMMDSAYTSAKELASSRQERFSWWVWLNFYISTRRLNYSCKLWAKLVDD